MCEFNHHKFDCCAHWGIECHAFCSKALWEAGKSGILRICTPWILKQSFEWSGYEEDEPPKPVEFLGLTGYCKMCVDALKLPAQIPERDLCGDQFLFYSPGQFNQHDGAPYLHIDELMATIPHLLGIEDQLTKTSANLGPMIFFPKRIKALTWAELRRFHLGEHGEWFCGVEGRWLGVDSAMSSKTILDGIGCNGGITLADRKTMAVTLKKGHSPQTLYTQVFEKRGMPFKTYQLCLDKILDKLTSNRTENRRPALDAPARRASGSSTSSLSDLSTTPKVTDDERIISPPQSLEDGQASQSKFSDDPFVKTPANHSAESLRRYTPASSDKWASERLKQNQLLPSKGVHGNHGRSRGPAPSPEARSVPGVRSSTSATQASAADQLTLSPSTSPRRPGPRYAHSAAPIPSESDRPSCPAREGWPSTARPARCALPKQGSYDIPLASPSRRGAKRTFSAMRDGRVQGLSPTGQSGRPDPSEDSYGSPRRPRRKSNLSTCPLLLNPAESHIPDYVTIGSSSGRGVHRGRPLSSPAARKPKGGSPEIRDVIVVATTRPAAGR